MGVIADLMVKVGADIGTFKSGMSAVNTDLERSGSQFSKFGALATGAGVAAIGAVTGIAAFGIAAVEKTTEAGQAAFQMSEKFGLASQQASAWLTVARHLGVDSDQLGSGFKFLSKNVENMNLTLQAGGKLSRLMLEPYALLKIHIKDSHGAIKPANELMLEMADRFARMPDGIQKTGLAIKIFGKQGMEMLPILNQGRKGLEDLMKQGKSTGEIMSGPQVEAAHKMYLAQQKLNSEMTGFTTLVGTALMPIASQFVGWLTGTGVPGVVSFARPFIAELNPEIRKFVGWLQTLGPPLKTAFGVLSTLSPFILAIGAAWVIWNGALLVTEGLQAIIIGAQFVAGLVAIVSKVGLLTVAQWLLNIAMDANPIGLITLAIAALVVGVVWAYKNVGWFRDIVDALGGAFSSFVQQFWKDVKPIFDWIGGTLVPLLEKAWGFLSKIGGSGGSSSVPNSGKGGKFGGIRAAGGPVFSGSSYWVGERGPEMFSPSTNGNITPNGGGGSLSVTVHAETNADPYRIAAEVGYQVLVLRRTR